MKRSAFFALVAVAGLALSGCLKDDLFVAPPAPPGAQLIHYWHFNTLPAGTITSVPADFTKIGSPAITYPGTGAGFIDNVDPGTPLNAKVDATAGLGLRARNPSDTRDLIITAPTTAYEKVVVTFATMRTSAGSSSQEFSYSVDAGATWVKVGLAYTVELDYAVKTIDLSAVAALANNPKVRFKIHFSGTEAVATTGNDRFDNFAVEAIPMLNPPPPPANTPELMHYWHFNTLPAGTVTSVPADFTKVGSPVITYPGTGAGFMDNVDPGSDVGLRMGAPLGLGLRPRNPANTRQLVIVAPSTGYKSLMVTFAVTRTTSGASLEQFQYSPDGGVTWVDVGAPYTMDVVYVLKTIDLSAITAVNNNPNLQFRILFQGPEASGTSGNNRFDNIAIDGTPL